MKKKNFSKLREAFVTSFTQNPQIYGIFYQSQHFPID